MEPNVTTHRNAGFHAAWSARWEWARTMYRWGAARPRGERTRRVPLPGAHGEIAPGSLSRCDEYPQRVPTSSTRVEYSRRKPADVSWAAGGEAAEVARVFPVANGVLKHQLYIQLSPAQIIFGRAQPPLYAVMTFWTYKSSGSPASGARINTEQSSIEQWCGNQLKSVLPVNAICEEVRTWDYGLDPAPRTVHRFSPFIAGITGGSGTEDADARIVALRSQPVGSTTRNRLNGRIYLPYCGATDATRVNVFTNLKTTYLTPSLYATNGNWILMSWRSGGAIRATPLVVTIDHVICLRAGVQRRRNPHYPAYLRGA